MDEKHAYVLVHSPLVGPLTWSRVAAELQQHSLEAIIPRLMDSPNSADPFWKQHADSIAQALIAIPQSTSITLVAHSGAGPLLTVIREMIVHPVRAYVFVDAGLPRNGASRLDLMQSEDAEWAQQFQQELEGGGTFPNWSFEDLQEVISEEALRRQMVRELQPRGVSFFTEPIPVFPGWPDAPCAYIRFSAPYQSPADQARRAGWPTYELEAGHFHMLVDPAEVTDLIVQAANNLS